MEVIWQCGKYYKAETDRFMEEASARDSGIGKKIRHFDFISRMDLAYAAADIVISRSGAGAVSELCAAHKAAIFVPSPNVAEDHQTHNAMALVKKDAAMLITDAEAPEKLLAQACALARDPERIIMMERNIAPLARPEAAEAIVNEIYGILGKND